MRRRDFIGLLSSAAASWPLIARAQKAVPRIGFLSLLSAIESEERVRAFLRGLGETGYRSGDNVIVDYLWADNQYPRLSELAADFVRFKVDLIVATTNAAAVSAQKATQTIPILFYIGTDPVQIGLVDSLNHPGRNATGIVSVSAAPIEEKRFEILHQAIPGAKRIGFLVNPVRRTSPIRIETSRTTAQNLGLDMHVVEAASEQELTTAFAELKRLEVGGLVIAADLSFFSWNKQLGGLAGQNALPAIHQFREFVAAGGLMSYGSSFTDSHRQLGIYAGRLLQGESAADLPVQQTTKVDLALNLKTAKVLGVTFPLSLLGRADEVIE